VKYELNYHSSLLPALNGNQIKLLRFNINEKVKFLGPQLQPLLSPM